QIDKQFALLIDVDDDLATCRPRFALELIAEETHLIRSELAPVAVDAPANAIVGKWSFVRRQHRVGFIKPGGDVVEAEDVVVVGQLAVEEAEALPPVVG